MKTPKKLRTSFIRFMPIFGLFVFFTALSSCTKAGLGGNAEIVAFPQHHGKAIKGATGYIKFNSSEAPASLQSYDLVTTPKAGMPDHVHFENLQPGDYYIYMVGYDSAIQQVVRGGIPYTLSRSNRNREVDVQVPVTE
jgi:hypothetical protein